MKRQWHFWVYIVASKSRHIYTGMTNNIARRIAEHKSGHIEGFTQKDSHRRIHTEVPHQPTGVLRKISLCRQRDRAGEADQRLGSQETGRVDRGLESHLGGFVR